MKPNEVKAEFSDIGCGIILTKTSQRRSLSLDLPIQDHLMKANEVKAEFSDIGCGIIQYCLANRF